MNKIQCKIYSGATYNYITKNLLDQLLVRIIELLRFLYCKRIRNHHPEFEIDKTILT